ncbi:MAG: hypothetical protein GX850_01335 [Clostridiaceae bacterium]|nr:hypothetical protein [Clostridiaceae bacterium]
MTRSQTRIGTRHIALLAIVCAILVTCLTVSCGINDELIGKWRLVESDDSTFAPGMLFVFNSDRSLLVEPGEADISEEEKQEIIQAREDTSLTYTSSPNGDLSLTLTKKDKRSVTVRMKYVLTEDTLSITDEEGLKLVFRRR